jgi:multidrug transporter EmrE-like cation transporter
LRWRNKEEPMSGLKIFAIVLIIAGALALAYGSFSFTRETHQTKIGPIELSVKEKETVNIPVWAGLGAVLIGVVLLVVGKGK